MPQSRTYASGRTDRQLSLREGRKWIVLRRYRTNTCRSTRSNDWTIFPHRLLCGAHCATAVSSSDSRRSTFEFHTSWLMNSMQQLFSGSSIDAAQRRTFHKPPLRERPLCARSGPSAWAPPKLAIRPFMLIRPPSSASISVSLLLQSSELACFLRARSTL
jgi:hypothetical protein